MRDVITTVLEVLAAVWIVAGVAMIYIPAACIVAGLCLLALSWGMTHEPGTEKHESPVPQR